MLNDTSTSDANTGDRRRFLRFLLTSGAAAGVNLGARWLLNQFVDFEIAVFIAFWFGVTTAYLLAKTYVFDSSGRSSASEFRRFLTVNVFALILVWTVSVGLARWMFPAIDFNWRPDDVAHFIGVVTPAVLSYFGHRFYTFAEYAP
jgi:putative flippase GtrA